MSSGVNPPLSFFTMYELALDLPVKYIDYQVGDITFALAPLCNDRPKQIDYTNKLIALKKQGRKILMDNGAYELGKSVPIEEYMETIIKVQPDFAVLPDVMKDGFRTCKLVQEFCELMDEQKFKDIVNIEWIVTPQGSDMDEFMNCYNTICEESIMDGILGLPKHIGEWANRVDVLLQLYAESDYTFHNVHLLGFNPGEFGIIDRVKKATTDFQIVSIDTKWPIKNMIKQEFKQPIDYYFYDGLLDGMEMRYRAKGFKLALEGKVGLTE